MNPGSSQHLWPSLVPLVPVLPQPRESDCQLGFEKLSPVKGQFCGWESPAQVGVTGTWGSRRPPAISAPRSSGSGSVVMQEGSCSARTARRGHCFHFFNHRKCCMLDDLQLSSEKQKGSELSLFQKVCMCQRNQLLAAGLLQLLRFTPQRRFIY